MQVIASVPQGLEAESCKELFELGARNLKSLKRSVSFTSDLRCFYKLHFQARLPFRFLREIASFRCEGSKELYKQIQESINWTRWLKPSMSFRVDISGSSRFLNHTHFTALTVKNAIIDIQREKFSRRSSIDVHTPDLCIHLHLNQNIATLSLDSSNQSLHKRGYRHAMGIAPLKENLASGLIRMSGWDDSFPLVDPFCGSGTLLIEAASIALGLAPGLNRSFICNKWFDFDLDIWKEEEYLARQIRNVGNYNSLKIIGCEQNTEIFKQANINILSAGLESFIDIRNCHFNDLVLPKEKGFLLCNPPYGKRLGNEEDLIHLYNELGSFCKENAKGWQLWLLNGNPKLSRFIHMKASQRIPISNGGIDCRWMNYKIN